MLHVVSEAEATVLTLEMEPMTCVHSHLHGKVCCTVTGSGSWAVLLELGGGGQREGGGLPIGTPVLEWTETVTLGPPTYFCHLDCALT